MTLSDTHVVERRAANPWGWQDAFGFVQAVEVKGSGRTIFCAGQASVDDDGKPVHAGDMPAQVKRAFDNLETVLEQAGTSLADVVRINYYTTDVGGLLGTWEAIATRLAAAECRPTSTLLGVQALAYPELLLEIEATAIASTPAT